MRATENCTRVQITCPCTVCKGRAASVPVSLMEQAKAGTKAHAAAIHGYVGWAHGTDPVSSAMQSRYLIKAA